MSGLPVNTFAQAAEYRKRYLATLALQAQNDAYNLQANQVYKQTGQPSRPPDTRSTTEKMGDIEKMKVDLRAGLMQITDGTNANETIEQLTPDEVIFTVQQLPSIVTDLKPKFSRGVPAQALIAYIRALRRKFLATNGVSFSAQEATAQQILNAVQAGVNMLGAPGGPFAPTPTTIGSTPSTPSTIASIPPESPFAPISPQPMSEDIFAPQPVRPQPIRPIGPEGARPRPPSGLPIAIGTSPPTSEEDLNDEDIPSLLQSFTNDYQVAASQFGPNSQAEWDEFPMESEDAFIPYPNIPEIAVQFLKMWAQAQTPEVKSHFKKGWENRTQLPILKLSLSPGVEFKLAQTSEQFQEEPNPFEEQTVVEEAPPIELSSSTIPTEPIVAKAPRGIDSAIIFQSMITSPKYKDTDLTKMVEDFVKTNKLEDRLVRNFDQEPILPKRIAYKGSTTASRPYDITDTNIVELIREIKGRGVAQGRRAREPASRFPTGRHILGYGLKPMTTSKLNKKKAINIDITKGLAYEPAPTFIPFGKYVINPSKLSSGVFDMRTLNGGAIKKYPIQKLSPALTKILNRIIGGKMPDVYDINEIELEDQHFIFNLANDAKINDRLKIPTPKRSKDNEEENRFEILKGEITAGNDSKELIKEFKRMLVKFSNDGRVNKNEAREILLDLAAAGH